MAHSNRKKLRDARGGLTRNQARKAKNQSSSTSSSNRLAETLRWMEENEQRKMNKSTTPTEEKVIRYAKTKKLNKRRKGVKERLENQLKAGTKWFEGAEVPLEENDIKRIKRELEILNSRIVNQ